MCALFVAVAVFQMQGNATIIDGLSSCSLELNTTYKAPLIAGSSLINGILHCAIAIDASKAMTKKEKIEVVSIVGFLKNLAYELSLLAFIAPSATIGGISGGGLSFMKLRKEGKFSNDLFKRFEKAQSIQKRLAETDRLSLYGISLVSPEDQQWFEKHIESEQFETDKNELIHGAEKIIPSAILGGTLGASVGRLAGGYLVNKYTDKLDLKDVHPISAGWHDVINWISTFALASCSTTRPLSTAQIPKMCISGYILAKKPYRGDTKRIIQLRRRIFWENVFGAVECLKASVKAIVNPTGITDPNLIFELGKFATDSAQAQMGLDPAAQTKKAFNYFGLDPKTATQRDVTKAYHKQSLGKHPDHFQDPIEKERKDKEFNELKNMKELAYNAAKA